MTFTLKLRQKLRKAKRFWNHNIWNYLLLTYRNLSVSQTIPLTKGEIDLYNRLKDLKINFIDVGARIDTVFPKYFVRAKLIHLIEPNPKFVKVLIRNLKSFENVKIHQIALSDKSALLPYFKNSQSLLPREVYGLRHDKKKLGTLVRCISFDEFVARERLDFPCFLKIDCEQFDYFVIKGGKQTFINNEVMVQFELSLDRVPTKEFNSIQNFTQLFPKVFNFFILDDEHNPCLKKLNFVNGMHPLTNQTSTMLDENSKKGFTFNILAVNPLHKEFQVVFNNM